MMRKSLNSTAQQTLQSMLRSVRLDAGLTQQQLADKDKKLEEARLNVMDGGAARERATSNVMFSMEKNQQFKELQDQLEELQQEKEKLEDEIMETQAAAYDQLQELEEVIAFSSIESVWQVEKAFGETKKQHEDTKFQLYKMLKKKEYWKHVQINVNQGENPFRCVDAETQTMVLISAGCDQHWLRCRWKWL